MSHPTTAVFTRLVRASEPAGDTPSSHIPFHLELGLPSQSFSHLADPDSRPAPPHDGARRRGPGEDTPGEEPRRGDERLGPGPVSRTAAASILQDEPTGDARRVRRNGDRRDGPIAEGRHSEGQKRVGDFAPARPVPVLDTHRTDGPYVVGGNGRDLVKIAVVPTNSSFWNSATTWRLVVVAGAAAGMAAP